MKFSHILVLYLSAMATPSALAVPLRRGDYCSPGTVDVRCIGHTDNRNPMASPHSSGGSARHIQERQLSQTLKEILAGLPLLGPILAPILGSLLGAIGLSEMDVASASKASLNAEQIATLAGFEFALSNAVHKVLLPDGNLGGGAQSKLKARGVVPLGELCTAAPLIGPFLQPVVSLLEAINLDSVDAKPDSVFSSALLTEDQSAKLALFQTVLRQEVASTLPNVTNSTTHDAHMPSKASPDDVKPSTPGPSPDTSGDDGPNSGPYSPNVPDSALPSPAPE